MVRVNIDTQLGFLGIRLLQIQEIKEKFKEAKVECIASLYDRNRAPYRSLDILTLRNCINEFSYMQWNGEETAKKYKDAILEAYDRASNLKS